MPPLNPTVRRGIGRHVLGSVILLGLASFGMAGDLLDHANLFVGTGYLGHTFPSATVPFGAVAPGPDCSLHEWHSASGYHYDKTTIMGFSQTHLSGTGLGEFGDFMLMPAVGPIQYQPGDEKNPESGYRSRFSHEDESARPGYYQVRLQDYNTRLSS